MDYRVTVSLVQNASIAVVTSIWYSDNAFKELLANDYLSQQNTKKKWQEIENNIAMTLKQLYVPVTTKALLLNLFQPIGEQILKWLEFHRFLNSSDIKLSDTLVWNSQGIIDSKTTAERILRNKDVCVLNRFRLACVNCIDVEIIKLWPEVRPHFYTCDNIGYTETTEVMFWICYLEDKVEELMKLTEYDGAHDFIQFASWAAVENNNDVAAKYFIGQLESHSLHRIIKNSSNHLIRNRLSCNPALLIYLLSHLNGEEQIELCIAQSENILIHFTIWPLQSSFLELANTLWISLTPIAYYNVLEEIIRKVSEFHWGEMYKEIFVDFWNKAPFRHRSYVIHKCINSTFLSRIFSLKGTDGIIRFILRESSAEQKLQMLIEFNGRQVIDFLLSKSRWYSLTLFIEGCISTQNDIDNLDKAYSEHVKQGSYLIITDVALNKFREILRNITEKLIHY